MATYEVFSPTDAGSHTSAFEQFRAGFQGRILAAGDDEYETARKIWNASIDKRPRYIARSTGVADVVAAVNFARERGLRLAIRGGGHNVGGRALCDDGLVIDFFATRHIKVDASTRTVTAEAGATLGEVDRATHEFGLAVPLGIVSRTGVAGLTLGGGVGWLIRHFGMSIDNVVSFDVVTADGRVLTATGSENPDLFWALRGGGGNFGVVTSFTFRAHPVSIVLGGPAFYPASVGRDFLRFFRDFMPSAPDELTAYFGFMHTPDGTLVSALLCCYSGDLADGERVIEPLRKFATPIADHIQPLPFPAMQSMLDNAFPDGNRQYWKSSLLRELSDGAIDVILERASCMPSPLSALVIEYYGGAAGRIKDTDTAFPHRQLPWDVIALAQWTDPAHSSENRAWARGLNEALGPFSAGAYLLSALDQESDEVIKGAFGANLQRLSEIKKKYDPENLFRVNQNIRPADT